MSFWWMNGANPRPGCKLFVGQRVDGILLRGFKGGVTGTRERSNDSDYRCAQHPSGRDIHRQGRTMADSLTRDEANYDTRDNAADGKQRGLAQDYIHDVKFR